MRDHPHPRPSGLAVAAHPDCRGFFLKLLARLLPPARSGGFGAGYALWQEANQARLVARHARQPQGAAAAVIHAESQGTAAPAIGVANNPSA
jgi:hypothetical protein